MRAAAAKVKSLALAGSFASNFGVGRSNRRTRRLHLLANRHRVRVYGPGSILRVFHGRLHEVTVLQFGHLCPIVDCRWVLLLTHGVERFAASTFWEGTFVWL